MKSLSILSGIGLLRLASPSFSQESADGEETTSERTPTEQQTDPDETKEIDITKSYEYTEDNGLSREFVDVRDYGVAGDGSTDDTAAIQAALDDAQDDDVVLIPEGKYLVGTNTGREGILEVPTDVDNLTIQGVPGHRSTHLTVAPERYQSHRNFSIFQIPVDSEQITGLVIRDLTLDGDRPSGAMEPSGRGIHCYPGGAGGGHDILVEDCWAENFSGAAVVSREGGVTFNRITSINNKQNYGFSEEDDSTANTDEYGIVLKNSVSKNANWVGIDHNRGGRVRLANVYSENNGHSGLKTTKDNRRTRVENTTFQDENHFAATRTNISTTADLPDPPLVIDLDTVSIRNATGGGIYLSGEDSSIQNSALVGGSIELRNCGGEVNFGGSFGALTLHSAAGGSVGELRITGTRNGPALWFNGNHDFTVETLYHHDNADGVIERNGHPEKLQCQRRINADPGPLDTPQESSVGAWSTHEK